MPEPRLSIGLPVYNGERFLRRAIDSILDQDFTDFELIISDNASRDATSEICERYAKQDSRVQYHRSSENRGAVWNHRRVVELARAQLFKWAAHDDECASRMLSVCVNEISQAPDNVVLVYPWSEFIDEEGKVTSVYKTSIASDNPAPHHRLACVVANVVMGTPMYGVARLEAVRRTRLIDVFAASDYVFLAEMALLGIIREWREPLLRKRLHPGRATEAQDTPEAMLNWLDPRRAGQRPRLGVADRIDVEYLRSVWRIPLSPGDRLKCCWTILAGSPTQRRRRERWRQRLFGRLSARLALP